MAADGDRPVRGLKALAARLDARSLRERALAFVVALAVLYAGWSNLLLDPLDARRVELQKQVPKVEADIATLETLAAQMVAERSKDPDAGPRAALERLRRDATRLEQQLVELTARLVPPRRMAAMLESVLTRETSLTLTRLGGLGVEPVVIDPPPAPVAVENDAARGSARASARTGAAREPEAAEPAAPVAAAPRPGLYRHGLRIEFEGGYLETLAYLRALESLESRFLWRALDFEVLEYPRARVAITVYSLSLDDAWIGI